jgi:hypothetical protein
MSMVARYGGRNGLLVERVNEPLPPPAWLTAEPDAGLVPLFLGVRCRRSVGDSA